MLLGEEKDPARGMIGFGKGPSGTDGLVCIVWRDRMLVSETVAKDRHQHACAKAIKPLAPDLHLSRKAIQAPEENMDHRRELQPLPKLGTFQA